MCDFVQDFPNDQAGTISAAGRKVEEIKWFSMVDDESVYSQLASPEFRLYEEIISI